jgi:hypothetical protein
VRVSLLVVTFIVGVASGYFHSTPIFRPLILLYFSLHPAYFFIAWIQPKLRWMELQRSGVLAEYLLTRITSETMISAFAKIALVRVQIGFLMFLGISLVSVLLAPLVSTSPNTTPIFIVFLVCIYLLPVIYFPLFLSEALFWVVVLSGGSLGNALLRGLASLIPYLISLILAAAFIIPFLMFSPTSPTLTSGLAFLGLGLWPAIYSYASYSWAKRLFRKAELMLTLSFEPVSSGSPSSIRAELSG